MEDQKWLEKPFDIESCYTEIQKLIEQYGPPLVYLNNMPVYNAAFLIELFHLALKKGSEYSLPPREEECYKENKTEYNYGNMETIMLMIGLTSLSWLSLNIKRKTEEGHCKNPAHDLKDGHPNCSIGKEFHGKLYDDLLGILQEITESIKINAPLNTG